MSEAAATPGPDDESLGRRLWVAHLGSTFAGVVFVFVVLKVLAVAHFGTTTALGLVAEGGTATLLVGAVVLSVKPLLFVVLAVVLYHYDLGGSSPPTRRTLRWVGALLGGATVVVSPVGVAPIVAFLPWFVLGGPGADRVRPDPSRLTRQDREDIARVARGAALLSRVEELSAEADPTRLGDPSPEEVEALGARAEELKAALDAYSAEMTSAAASARARAARWERLPAPRTMLVTVLWYAALALVALLSDRPWLPAERITASGAPSVVGYVLRSQPEGTVVLSDSPRRLVRIDGAVTRSFCQLRPPQWGPSRPIVSLLYRPAAYPTCNRP